MLQTFIHAQLVLYHILVNNREGVNLCPHKSIYSKRADIQMAVIFKLYNVRKDMCSLVTAYKRFLNKIRSADLLFETHYLGTLDRLCLHSIMNMERKEGLTSPDMSRIEPFWFSLITAVLLSGICRSIVFGEAAGIILKHTSLFLRQLEY